MYVPLYQLCKVIKKGASDGWGGKISLDPVEYRCRISEGERNLKNVSTTQDVREVRHKDSVTIATIFFKSIIDLDLEDEIEYTNELGKTHIYRPIAIKVVRGVSGYPLYTVVEVGAK